MNLTEKMALDCGVKINKPFIDRLFMPVKNHRFIIFDTRSRISNGEYDYYVDVLNLIKEDLKRENIDVFQICHEKSYRLQCDRCFISLNKKQEAYLISKCELLISNENYSSYIAAAFNTKRILLYSVFDSRNTAPPWNRESQIILESDRCGNQPSYGTLNEKPKTINLISPFDVAKNILNNLNIKNNLDRFELIHIGEFYSSKIIEVIPDFISGPKFLLNSNINLRLDLVDSLNIDVLHYWMRDKKVNLITDKNININLLLPFRNNIVLITVMICDDIQESFLKNCKALGVPLKILCSDKNSIKNLRLKFLDWNIEQDFSNNSISEKLKKLNNKSKFVSSKILLSKGKQFSCKLNWLENKELDKNPETVKLCEEFEKEIEFFKIYNEREESNISVP